MCPPPPRSRPRGVSPPGRAGCRRCQLAASGAARQGSFITLAADADSAPPRLSLLRRPPPSPRRRPCTGGSGSRHSRPLPWAASLAQTLFIWSKRCFFFKYGIKINARNINGECTDNRQRQEFLSDCGYIGEMKLSVRIYCLINVKPYVYLLIYTFFFYSSSSF